MEKVEFYGWLLWLVFVQYMLVFPITLFFGGNRKLYGFTKTQWFLYWMPYGFWIYSIYLVYVSLKKEIKKLWKK